MAKKQSNAEIQLSPARLAEALRVLLPQRHNLLVCGAPGLGKTDIIKQACAEAGADVVMFHPVISDPTDFKGMPGLVPQDDDFEAKFFTFSNLKRLIDCDKLTVAFADDLGQAPPLVQAAWMQLVLGGQLEDKQISPNVVFLSATNRKEDKAGVQGILEPLKSRFTSIVELVTDVDEWLKWARANGIHPMVRAFVRFRGMTALHDFEASNDMTNSPSPRTNKHVSDLIHSSKGRSLSTPLLRALVAGAAGSAYAAEFMAFRQVVSKLPKLKAIHLAPKKAPVPDDQSALFALVESMLDKASKKTVDSFLTYLLRVPEEFQAWFYEQIKESKPELVQTQAMTKWAAAHGVK